MKKYRIFVPGEPVGKARPRFSRFGHAYTPKKTADYEKKIASIWKEKYGSLKPLEGPLHVRMYASFKIPESWSKRKKLKTLEGKILPTKKPDCDNIAKIIDALNGIAWFDDSQIVSQSIVKVYSEEPGLDIVIIPFDEEGE